MSPYGWIIYNGHLQGDKFIDFARWFHDAAAQQQIKTDILANNTLLSVMSGKALDIRMTEARALPDFVICTDKDFYLAKQFEMMGIPVFNSADAIATSDDKIASYQAVAKAGIPTPQTIIQPKIFPGPVTMSEDHLSIVQDILGFPLIVKEAFGSFGEQVHLIHTMNELKEIAHTLYDKPFVFQEYIRASHGRDIRLHVVGNHVAAGMERHNPHDFRANITSGGSMKRYTPDEAEEKIAVEAAKAIGCDFAGVDLLFGASGTPVVCEVNSNAHIRNMYDATGINVAQAIMTYITGQLS